MDAGGRTPVEGGDLSGVDYVKAWVDGIHLTSSASVHLFVGQTWSAVAARHIVRRGTADHQQGPPKMINRGVR
jgi:hypothetical protein